MNKNDESENGFQKFDVEDVSLNEQKNDNALPPKSSKGNWFFRWFIIFSFGNKSY
jgi:hypothetical protein